MPKGFAYGVTATPIAWDHRLDDVPQSNNKPECSRDWAVVRLNQCVDDTVPYLQLVSMEMKLNAAPVEVKEAGMLYNMNYLNGVLIDPSCHVKASEPENPYLNQQEWTHYCSEKPGASGSPLLLGNKVIGMNCGDFGDERGAESEPAVEDPDDDRRGNLAIPISEIKDRIDKVLKSDESYVSKSIGRKWTIGTPWKYPGKATKTGR